MGEIYAFLYIKQKNKNSMPREVAFSVTFVPNKVWGEIWGVLEETGHGLEDDLFFSMLSRGSLY